MKGFDYSSAERSETRNLRGIVLFGLAILVALSSLAPIGTSHEAREAHIVHHIVSTGEWILPHRNGIVPSKPPLHHWLGASVAEIFGVNASPFIARLPSVVAGAWVWYLTGLLGLMLGMSASGQPGSPARTTALFALGILGTTYGFVTMALDARVDMVCAAAMLTAVYVVARRLHEGVRDPQPLSALVRQEDLFWFYLCAGIAVLAKGPLGLVLPLLLVWSMCIACAGVRATAARWSRPAWGWGVFLCIAVPWYVAAGLRDLALSAEWSHGDRLIARQLVFENLLRFFGGEAVNTKPSWFYLPSLLRTAAPWSALLFVFLLMSRQKPRSENVSKTFGVTGGAHLRAIQFERGFLWAFVAGVAFFSVAAGKRHSYLLPLFPLLSAYLASVCMNRFSALSDACKQRVRGMSTGLLWAALALFAALFVILVFPLVPYDQLHSLMPQLVSWQRYWVVAQLTLGQFSPPLMVLVALGIVMVSLTLLQSPPQARAVLLVQAGFLCMALSVATGNVIKYGLKGFPELAQQVAALADQKSIAVIRAPGDELFDPILYYLGRPVRVVVPQETGKVCDGRTLVLAREHIVRDLLQGQPVQAALLSRYVLRSTVDIILSRPGLGIVAIRCRLEEGGDDEGSVRVEQSGEILRT